MARNEEKALTLFNKWDTFKRDFHSKESNKRPLLATDCESLPQAQKIRRDLIRDITKNISAIGNASLGEHRIRELNDTINKLMKQKHYWDKRIKELGGTLPSGKQFYDVEGKELPGAPFYKYYGAAKNLPGVRELFGEKDEEQAIKRQKRSRKDIYRYITPDYYGYRDDDDGILAAKEAEVEKRRVAEAEEEFKLKKLALVARVRSGDPEAAAELAAMEYVGEGEDPEAVVIHSLPTNSGCSSNSSGAADKGEVAETSSGVTLPSQQEISSMLIEQRRKQLLESLL